MKKSMQTVFCLFLVLIGMTGIARAQEAAPPVEQLQAPAAKDAATIDQTAPAKTDDETANTAEDPCPLPSAALASAPDDLAKVQEDIDRFTLCVQRAQLLERLNESAVKSQTSNDTAMGFNPVPMMPGLAGPQQAGLSPLYDPTLAGADVTPVPGAVAGIPGEPAPAAEPAPKADWTIREISGAGAGMQAKLVNPDGDEVRVKDGDHLESMVVRVTPTGVSVREDNKTRSLEWSKS